MNTSRQTLGRWGENQAAIYLENSGYFILGRNVRTPFGEIDLIARQDSRPESKYNFSDRLQSMIVFVEVKTRSSTVFGYPEDSITHRKMSHMLDSAQFYMQEHPELEGDWRVDVIAIYRTGSESPPTITHFENAVNSFESGG
jgi:putative endonuclease